MPPGKLPRPAEVLADSGRNLEQREEGDQVQQLGSQELAAAVKTVIYPINCPMLSVPKEERSTRIAEELLLKLV